MKSNLKVEQLHSQADSRLVGKFLQGGRTECIDEAIDLECKALKLCPAGHPKRYVSLARLSSHLSDRYHRFGVMGNLDEAIVFGREALDLRPQGHPDWSWSLHNLGVHLSTRYKMLSNMGDLDEAIVLGREALDFHPSGHPERSSSLYKLAIDLSTRYEKLDVMGDLDEAIVHSRETLDLRLQGHPERPSFLNNLAIYLGTRYNKLGIMGDLDEAIVLGRQALDLCLQGHPERSSFLHNLASCFSIRYQKIGVIGDLDEAISLGREVLDLRLQGHPHRSLSLFQLARDLSTRYKKLGVMEDLDEVIVLRREALDHCQKRHSDWWSLHNLAGDLSMRYKKLDVMADLDEAIILGRDALDLTPQGHPERSSSLHDLAIDLFTHYKKLGIVGDLDEAIVLGREALDLCPQGHPERSSSLHNLASYFFTRYEKLGVAGDLDEAIVLGGEALDLRPQGHPRRLSSLHNLASYFASRYEKLCVMGDLDEAIILGEEALNLRPQGHRWRSLHNLVRHLSTRYKKLGAMGDLNDAIVLGREAVDLLPTGNPVRATLLEDFAPLLFAPHYQPKMTTNLDDAVFLSRELLGLRPQGHPFRPESLNGLANHLFVRYQLLGIAEDFNEAILLDREALDLCPEGGQIYIDRQHSLKELEHLGDNAMDLRQYDTAISHYSTALSLIVPSLQGILVKRSKAWLASGSWKQALEDANRATRLDPSCPWGYETKHAALHKAGDYDRAIDAFNEMLSKLARSSDSAMSQHADKYITPSSTQSTIRNIVQKTLRRLPRVLIDTTTGHLQNRTQLASSFESQPIFGELVSSMTTRTDHARIKREVRRYFQYVMLSHKWEDDEPLFQQMTHVAVYDLDKSPTHDKLQTFCKIVRDAGFNWAWSDTCCIDKLDHFVLQEALVAMFRWYQGSALTIVFLRGVFSSSGHGALVKSIWNTRAWTLQEYVASKIIRFYTEDWTPYLDLQSSNHKESPEIITEMEEATGVSALQLMALRPGLTSICEKLRLASTRETTLVEDAAYSLLGIFSVTGIPAIYGEGEGSLGRLLAHVLAGSGDASILAWTGESGGFNSCLPAHITTYNGSPTSHILPLVSDAEIESVIPASQSSFYFDVALRLLNRFNTDLNAALRLYDTLNTLPPPWFAASRMKLPCITFEFQLPPRTSYQTRSGRVYRVDTAAFGMVEIKTRQDLWLMNTLYLAHPWIDALLGREEVGSAASVGNDGTPSSPNRDDEEVFDKTIDDGPSLPEPEPESPPLRAPVTAQLDKETQARRLVARLRQPFGALLLSPVSTGGRAVDYRRVAADSLIKVQIQESVPLADILGNVRTLDVL